VALGRFMVPFALVSCLCRNVNYDAAAIRASIAQLDEVGIAYTDAGANRALARGDPDAGRSANFEPKVRTLGSG